jgi:adenylate cyclase class IV
VLELELKAVVPDPDAVRLRLNGGGAVSGFRGRLCDRRFDRDGVLTARDEVLRIRRWEATDGSVREEVAWKGPTGTRDGYKAREEIECQLAGGAPADRLLAALRYAEVYRIDRHVELYRLGEASARLEWYPALDTLIEVEGDPEAIEQVIALTGIPRATFSNEPLDHFIAAYQARTGRSARVVLDDGEEPAHWPS